MDTCSQWSRERTFFVREGQTPQSSLTREERQAPTAPGSPGFAGASIPPKIADGLTYPPLTGAAPLPEFTLTRPSFEARGRGSARPAEGAASGAAASWAARAARAQSW